ncbi:MAG TPA: type II/IV secretion system protein, partial [Mitsuokella multacida]|nr:type II/IV secretion system protein [Mitsuokella multacida]
LYQSRGCAACHGTGYRGRTVLAELLVPHEAVREGILQKIPRREMVERAKACGMRSLLEDGRAKARAGITSWQEVRRVLYG